MSKTEFGVGNWIQIPCRVKKIPYEDEKLVSFETLEGKIEGFVRILELLEDGEEWTVRAIIDRVEEDRLVAWVKGEFDQTAGEVHLRKDAVRLCKDAVVEA